MFSINLLFKRTFFWSIQFQISQVLLYLISLKISICALTILAVGYFVLTGFNIIFVSVQTLVTFVLSGLYIYIYIYE
jgi:hypothetical protein